MNKRTVGHKAEDKAIAFLETIGYKIINKNYFTRYGEIDIIALDQDIIVFIEVKYRKNCNFGSPLDAISYRKISSMCKVARIYLHLEKLEKESRFDVISIIDTKIEHLKNAFDYIY